MCKVSEKIIKETPKSFKHDVPVQSMKEIINKAKSEAKRAT